MAQFVTRLDDGLAGAVDDLVSEGIVASRSEAVREALAEFVERRRRALVGRAIVDGYEREPQTDAELAGLDDETRRMILEEPW